jgi:hypothetical protein
VGGARTVNFEQFRDENPGPLSQTKSAPGVVAAGITNVARFVPPAIVVRTVAVVDAGFAPKHTAPTKIFMSLAP